MLNLLTLRGILKLAFKLSHRSFMKICCVGAHQYSEWNNSSPYSHFQLCCVPPVADTGLQHDWAGAHFDTHGNEMSNTLVDNSVDVLKVFRQLA